MNMEAPGQGNNQGQLPARGRGGRRRGARVRGGGVGGRGRGGQRQQVMPDETCATLVDHVVNHGLTMAEMVLLSPFSPFLNPIGVFFCMEVAGL